MHPQTRDALAPFPPVGRLPTRRRRSSIVGLMALMVGPLLAHAAPPKKASKKPPAPSVRKPAPGSSTTATKRSGVQPAQTAPKSTAPPTGVLAVWQPLRPNLNAPALGRSELKAAVTAYRKKRWRRACAAVDKQLDRLMDKAARLFYAPVRKGADLDGIDHYLAKYLRGKAPLLEVKGELFAPAAPLRALATAACVRANRPATAARFLSHVALSQPGQRLRTALALVRWQASGRLDRALVSGDSGGAATWLLRAFTAKSARRRKLLARARSTALPGELLMVRTVGTWLETQR
ncbi:MAG: hypothetical protein KC502_03490 [Myxococcales bacterium]|nr:hypothetical protein [Myxococcales bacterium]